MTISDNRSAGPETIKKLRLELPTPNGGAVTQQLFRLIKEPAERFLGLSELQRLYDEFYRGGGPESGHIFQKFLEFISIQYRCTGGELSQIPQTGPAIVVSNHPFGGIEGVILAEILRQIRPDTKIMANFLLQRIEEAKDLFIFVDPFGTDSATERNLKPIRECIRFVRREQGLLGIFPAGTVSHFQWKKGFVTDPPWSPTIARVIRLSGAPVIPIFFNETNGLLFQLLGLIHPRLRTAMLPRELLNKRNTTIEYKVGSPIPFEKLNEFEADEDMLTYLRLRTYVLASKKSYAYREGRTGLLSIKKKPPAPQEEIVESRGEERLRANVEKLPADQRLLETGELAVYVATKHQIPDIIHEIGRLRELTFRVVGEGSGKSIDLDPYDEYYFHLFVWNSKKHELVGAYRLGKTDEILAAHGKKGLYTSTLFAYPSKLIEDMGPALEMGRSFIRLEYQRSYSALLLLWRGIGTYIVKNPRYKILFGPVSISNNYDSLSRQLIVYFLKANNFHRELGKLIRPRNPLRLNTLRGWDLKRNSHVVKTIDDMNSLLNEIETEQMGIPILLRQYLRLGGKLVSFNVDPDFGECLDGLIVVDMTKTDRRMLEKYFGKEGADSFLAANGIR